MQFSLFLLRAVKTDFSLDLVKSFVCEITCVISAFLEDVVYIFLVFDIFIHLVLNGLEVFDYSLSNGKLEVAVVFVFKCLYSFFEGYFLRAAVYLKKV